MLAFLLIAAGLRAEPPLKSDLGLIQVRGDRLDYDRESGWLEVTGKAVISKGDQELRADYVRMNTITEEAEALGNVTLRRGTEVWQFKELRYDFNTEEVAVVGMSGMAAPFRFEAESSEKTGERYVLQRARVTTCELDAPHSHYHIRARKVTVKPGRWMRGRGATWYFGRVPVMYLPFWWKDLRKDFGFEIEPGYDSRMGAFLLTAYRYRINEWLKGKSHVDYRSRRGVALGQDFAWSDPDDRWDGDLNLYYLHDRRPLDDDDPPDREIDPERWRVYLRERYRFTGRDYVLLQADAISDPDMRQDFFEDEYRRSAEPDNYTVYLHRGDGYAASVLLRKRLNDFYSRVERLPELSLSILRQPILETGLYYESQNAAALLQQVWDEALEREAYSVFRIDSAHRLYRPFKTFGFLNLNPRVGYRGTYYSQTLDEAGEEAGSTVRSRFELGQEVSFKAFRHWQRPGGALRHVVEPYANYTYSPEPNVTPSELRQFDFVDGLDMEHWVQLGVRNKLQVKRNQRPFDLVDVDVNTVYRIERPEDEDPIRHVFMDAEFRPVPWLWVDVDGAYNVPESAIDTFNTQIGNRWRDRWLLSLEHRYRRESNNLVLLDWTLRPGRPWSYNVYARYEFENSRLEEAGGYVQRNRDCMSIRTIVAAVPGFTRADGTQRDDEWRVGLELWLTAYPRSHIGARYRK